MHNADMEGVSLRGANLSNANLSGVSLVGADLTGVQLKATDLSGANLVNAVLDGVDLADAKLDGAHISRPTTDFPKNIQDILKRHFDWIDGDGEGGERADLTNADLERIDLPGMQLNGAVHEPGLVAVLPGSGEIMMAPVSVCHQVSTIGQRKRPTCSWYHIQASGLMGSPTDPSRRRRVRS
jgi:hypothetical protein